MENGNRKRKYVVLGRQTINDNRRLLLQQTCPSMVMLNNCKSVFGVTLKITLNTRILLLA